MGVLEAVLADRRAQRLQRDRNTQNLIGTIQTAAVQNQQFDLAKRRTDIDEKNLEQRILEENRQRGLDSLRQQDIMSKIASREKEGKVLDHFLSGNAGGGGSDVVLSEFDVGGAKFKNLAAQKKIDEGKQLATNVKELEKFIPAADKALVALEGIEELAKKLPNFTRIPTGFGSIEIPGTDQRGLIESNLRRLNAGLDVNAQQKDVVRFMGKMSQELIPLARNLAEEKGPITDPDVDRIEKGLGKLETPLEDKLFLLNELKEKVSLSLQTKMKQAKRGRQDIESLSPRLANLIPVEFKSVEEVEAANLPKGTIVIINGRKARVT